MKRIHLLLVLAVLSLPFLAAPAQASGTGTVVVSEVFAAGGNSGAPYANDYVELLNLGSSPVPLGGWTLQYASATSTSWQTTVLAGSIPAGGRYLVELAGGASGAALPNPDAIGSSNLASSGGKVALVRSGTVLTCGDVAGSCSSVADVEDLVGYGSASDYEGSGAAPAPTTTLAIARAGGGCTDTDSNVADFATATPDPLNASAPAAACAASPGGSGGGASVDVDVQPVLSVSLDHAALSFPGAVPGSTPAPDAEGVTVTSNDANGYTLVVHRTAFTPADLPLGIGVTLPSGASAGGAPADGSLGAMPVAPAPDLVLGSTAAPTAAGGETWATQVGFVSPLPFVPSGHYTATVTFTVIGR